MGGDGGVIANQRRFLRACSDGKEKKEVANARDAQRERAKVCALTSMPLGDSVAGCRLGRLYNSEDLLGALIAKDDAPAIAHIRTRKDFKILRFTNNPAYRPDAAEDCPRFVCPVTQLEFNGVYPFVFIWTTGFVLSEKALRELGAAGLAEYGPFSECDVVKLWPAEEEAAAIRARLLEEGSKAKKESKKESKKRKAGADAGEVTDLSTNTAVPAAAPVAAASSQKSVKLSMANAVAATAIKAVQAQAATSSVYKRLFHEDKDAAKSDKDLFMCVSGVRYTL